MRKKERGELFVKRLSEHYPTEIICYLDYDPTKPYELLFATILSAQCTDERVNLVTARLFQKYLRLEDYVQAPLAELEQDLRQINFFRNKAKNIQSTAHKLLTLHGGVVPSDVEALVALDGVGRKTANVVRCHVFNLPSVVVDTHVKRIVTKIGLSTQTDPTKIEFELMKILPVDSWTATNHRTIAHGRAICKAPTPKCELCFMTDICKDFQTRATRTTRQKKQASI